MKMEEMTLYDLKNLTKLLRQKYKLLKQHKIYNLCKYDLICILRNSGLIDETIPRKLKIESFIPSPDGEFVEFEYVPKQPFKRSYYKGDNCTYGRKMKSGSYNQPAPGFTIKRGSFIVSFD